jgi:hypothetical protein
MIGRGVLDMFSTIRTYWIEVLIIADAAVIIHMLVWLFLAGWLQLNIP